MAAHNDTGKRGEALARALLLEKGYWIEAVNWRCGKAEVDIIARQGEVLVFVEVKTRSTDRWGRPTRFVRPAQTKLLSKAANEYMRLTHHDWEIRFDLIAVLLLADGQAEVEHLEDAFFPGW